MTIFETIGNLVSRLPSGLRIFLLQQTQNQGEDLSQCQKFQIHHAITAQQAADQSPRIGGLAYFQKLDGPIQKHDQTKQKVYPPIASDTEMPNQSKQFTDIDSCTACTYRKLISFPKETPFRQLMATQLFSEVPPPQPHYKSFLVVEASSAFTPWYASKYFLSSFLCCAVSSFSFFKARSSEPAYISNILLS